MSETTGKALGGDVLTDDLAPPRRVPFDAPWDWLAEGWRDMWVSPELSLAYGAVFAGVGALTAVALSFIGTLSILPPLLSGFLLVGPLVAVGLYEASRRRQRGETVTLSDMALAGFRAPGQLGLFASFLLFAFLLWMQIALLMFMLFLGANALPPPSAFLTTLLFTPSGLSLLVVGTIVGGLIAAFMFAMSVVAVPMLLDRPVDAVTAARASFAAVVANPQPMALWAALIAGMVAVGLATLFLGFVIIFPLIGHASWHAYAAIYGDR